MAALRARAWRIPHDLDAKGAVPVGLTTASEFGGPNLSIAKLNGITHNPWTHGRTAGGRRSSVVGSSCTAGDGGGSIRIPAAFTGLVGMKATAGPDSPHTPRHDLVPRSHPSGESRGA